MRNLLLFLHLAAAIFWMGGMGFVLLALRPAAHAQLQPPQRLPDGAGAAPLLRAGDREHRGAAGHRRAAADAGARAQAPRGWHAMAGLGVLMVLVFGHIFFAPWRRMQRAVAAQEWPEGGRRVNQIALLVKVNFALGWIAIAAVMLWR